MRRALVASGGGSKGAFSVGTISHLITNLGLDFDVYSGTSTGALIVSALSQAKDYQELTKQLTMLQNVWFGIKGNDCILGKNGLSKYIDFPGEVDNLLLCLNNGIYNLHPLRKIVEANVDPIRLATSGKEYRIGVVDLQSGKYHGITQNFPNIHDYIIASCSMPVLMSTVKIDGLDYIDGGARDVAPIRSAIEALKLHPDPNNEYELYICLASPLAIDPIEQESFGLLETLKRSVTIMNNEIFNNDILQAQKINDDIEKGIADKDKIKIKIHLFQPSKNFGDSLTFNPDTIREAYLEGLNNAQEKIVY